MSCFADESKKRRWLKLDASSAMKHREDVGEGHFKIVGLILSIAIGSMGLVYLQLIVIYLLYMYQIKQIKQNLGKYISAMDLMAYLWGNNLMYM